MKLIVTVLSVFLLSACERIPLKTFEIETKSGETIKLSCPVVESGRSKLTYIIDRKCIIIN